VKRFSTTENRILLTFWIFSIITYSFALFNNYSLFLSDYMGLTGLTFVTLISVFYPKIIFNSLLFLLTLGLFNIFSFVYFFNFVLTFAIFSLISPGIQLLSLITLLVLFFKRKTEFRNLYISLFGRTEEEKKIDSENLKNSFKTKFSNMTDKEIELRLQDTLIEEARQALFELTNERKNNK